MEIILQLIQNQPWFGVVAAIISLASAIAAITPTPKPGTPLAKVYGIIDFLALNIGKAKDTGKKN
jgi:predicted outer membrane lipoprotein